VPASTRVADFDHMLAFADVELCSGETEPTSLRIHLDFFQRLAEVIGVGRFFGTRQQAAGGVKNLPDRATGAGQGDLCYL
jgi:hypothetical protein